jgi:hypothetical protein
VKFYICKITFVRQILIKIKMKLALYRPTELQEVEAPTLSGQSTHECGKIVSPTQRAPLSLREDPWYLFLLGAESTPGP